MPKSRNDPFKRKCAQALNHQAAAILDINDVFSTFDAQTEKLGKVYLETKAEKDRHNWERYQTYTNDLKNAMMGQAAVREGIIRFINTVWDLDEDSIKVYMG